jgi:hypothetical protein
MSIIAGVSSGDRTTSQLAKLDSLRFGPGYLQDSSVVGSNETTLAPYLSGYLLEALGIECRGEEMRFLLDNLWTLMAQPGDDYSGGSWEYVVRFYFCLPVLGSRSLMPLLCHSSPTESQDSQSSLPLPTHGVPAQPLLSLDTASVSDLQP